MLDLTDVSCHLSRWRLRVQDLDFEVRYRKGAKNVFADAVLRLPPLGHSSVQPDLAITCLVVSDTTAESLLHPTARSAPISGARRLLPIRPRKDQS